MQSTLFFLMLKCLELPLLNQHIYIASHLRQGEFTLTRRSSCICANSKGRCREIGRTPGYYKELSFKRHHENRNISG